MKSRQIVFSLFLLLLPVIMLFPSYSFATLSVTTFIEKKKVAVNRPFTLDITLSWEGDAEDYLVTPPVLDYPKGVEQKDSSFFTSSSTKHYTLSYRYTLIAHDKGTVTLPRAAIKYWKKGEKKETTLLTDEISFEVVSLSIAGLPLIWFIIIIGVVLLLGSLIGGIVIRDKKIKGKKHSDRKAIQEKTAHLLHKLQVCKKYMIKGETVPFYQCLLEIIRETDSENKALIDKMGTTLEQVQFGGYRPSAEELSIAYRLIEKKVQSLSTDSKDEKLDEIKFA